MKHNPANILGLCAALCWLGGCTVASEPAREADDSSTNTAAGASAHSSMNTAAGGRAHSPANAAAGSSGLATADAGAAQVCDDAEDAGAPPPVLEPKVVQLWPPNHKFHDIGIADCVDIAPACGVAVQAEFTWASSDEPVDDRGDGHHAPDIMIAEDCQRVSVRSERQGPSDGRVYKLGVRVIDSNGQRSDSECQIVVDHDQRGVQGADSGEAYRIVFNGTNGGPTCDGTQPPPPPQPPQPPMAPPPVQPPVEPPPVQPPPVEPPPADVPQ